MGRPFRTHNGCPGKSFAVYLDGVQASSVLLSIGWRAKECKRARIDSTFDEGGAFRKFLFAACQLTGKHSDFSEHASVYLFLRSTDQDDLLGESKVRCLGVIEAKLHDVCIVGTAAKKGNVTLPPLKIHEKAKKGFVHGTQ